MSTQEHRSLAEKFVAMSPEQKDFAILVAFYVVVLILLTPLSFLRYGAIQFGWALGGAVSVFSYWSISKVPSWLSPSKTPLGISGRSVLYMSLRMFLYIAVLLVSAICTFMPEWFGGFSGFSFWGVMAALIPMPFFLIFSSLRRLNKTPHIVVATPAKKEDEASEKEPKE